MLQTGQGTNIETAHTRIGGTGAIALIKCVSICPFKWPLCEAEKQQTLVLLVPRGLPDPVEGKACVCSDLDGSCLRLSDRLLDRLHQVLSVVHQHLSGLLGGVTENMRVRKDAALVLNLVM